MRLWILFGMLAGLLCGQEAMPELTAAQKAEAKRLIQAIRKDPRGPYGDIWWYCKDGKKLPPKGVPCGKVGGNQHAQASAAAGKMELLNYDLADFLTGMKFERFFDAARNHYRLRQYVMIDYLTGRENGWIYSNAYARRGVRQSEDEEAAAQRLLAEMLGQHEWVAKEYFLALQVVSAVPHGVQGGRTREIRSLSAAMAEATPSFQPIRGKIHSNPEVEDIAKIREYVKRTNPRDTAGFEKLIALIQAEYGDNASLAGFDLEKEAERSLQLRAQLTSAGLSGAQRLAAADAQLELQTLAFRYGSQPSKAATRRDLLVETTHWIKLAAGSGWLSMRQLEALLSDVERALGQKELTPAGYEELASYLEGSADWSNATTNWAMGEAQKRYGVIEPLAGGLSDELLRRSVVLHLANRVEALTRDSDAMTARQHRLLSSKSRRGIRGLNPGVAIGLLEIVESEEVHVEFEPDRIYVIPATVADLKPMRGILTLDSGNALSHAQLLAANLGIPNCTVPSTLLKDLQAYRGKKMFYAVTPKGTVVLRPWTELSAAEQTNWEGQKLERKRVALDTSKTNVKDRRLRLLEETSMADSGVLCGPKAANLGQLKRMFPQQVAPGVVVPFGVYFAHAAKKNAAGVSIADLVKTAYAEAERMRAARSTPDALRTYMRPKLEEIRRAILGMKLDAELEAELSQKLRAVFGPDGTYGVFVRSDTNAEDLPQFTGAGLNLTLPNIVGEKNIGEALKAVWASPFEERAWAWRTEALESSDQVYPSVVLLRTVPSDKSGVMATANLSTLSFADLTVNVNEGVAAVVDGGVSESLLLQGDGGVRLLAQARAEYRKMPQPKGGYAMVATSGSDYILSSDEIAQLRGLAKEVNSKLKAAQDGQGADLPWDIEFGFEKGQLRLFQIRPLVRYRETKTLDALGTLEGKADAKRVVALSGALENQ